MRERPIEIALQEGDGSCRAPVFRTASEDDLGDDRRPHRAAESFLSLAETAVEARSFHAAVAEAPFT